MNRVARLAALFALAAAPGSLIAVPALAQTQQEEARFQQAQARFQNEMNIFRAEYDRYQQARANRGGYRDQLYDDRDPRYSNQRYNDDRDDGDYDAARYYRDDPRYQERVLAADDRVYRGYDGRYYCKRNDGTTGLIIGAVGGGILGNVIDGGRSRVVGTLLGGGLGAIAGKAIDQGQSQVRCR